MFDAQFSSGAATALGRFRKLFIEYDFTQELSRQIQLFHQVSEASDISNLMLLYGDTGSGKSTLVNRYINAVRERVKEAHVEQPVLFVMVPSSCTPKALASSLLVALEDPCYNKGTLTDMTVRVVALIRKKKVSLIVLDEFQHFIDRENKKVAYCSADWLKELVIQVNCPFLLVGLPSTSRVICENQQLERRVLTKLELRPLPFSTKADRERLQTLLLFFAEELPFGNARMIAHEEMARRIHIACRGRMGYLARLLQQAGMVALEEEELELKVSHFSKAYDRVRADDKDSLLGVLNPFLAEKKQ
ncbi:TniB family NTP-binding protein [Kordiimonas sp.]|uniref:TniB family NTP-binding protein n=1 Tax=Kordiimonas sp. TaxID=1970157 RepID=UPI003B528B13